MLSGLPVMGQAAVLDGQFFDLSPSAVARGRAAPHPAGADQGFLRAQPSCLRRRDLGAGRAGDHRWLERLSRPVRPRPPAEGRRRNARPSRAEVGPSRVLELEALGARHPSMACAASICAVTSTSSCSAGTAAAILHRLSTTCSASARACDLPATATSSNNAPDHGGRPMPPPEPRSASIGGRNISLPACLTAPKVNFPKPESPRTSPDTVRKSRPERRKPINILCDRNQREKPFWQLYT